MLPTQPLPSYVIASSDRKVATQRTTHEPEPAHHEHHIDEDVDFDFDVDDFYDNVPCTD